MADPPNPDLAGHRVLVVEDEQLIGLMLADVLEELGSAVLGPAATVSEAIALVEREPVTAALLDLNLRGETVYPVADRLAAAGIPFVFITGYGHSQLVRRHAGVPVLTKPFGPRQLAEMIASQGWAR
jgi:CheY-like chemotaxis protein